LAAGSALPILKAIFGPMQQALKSFEINAPASWLGGATACQFTSLENRNL
jgi:hypothetical protein